MPSTGKKIGITEKVIIHSTDSRVIILYNEYLIKKLPGQIAYCYFVFTLCLFYLHFGVHTNRKL